MSNAVAILYSGPVFEETSRGIHDALTLVGVEGSLSRHSCGDTLSDDVTYVILGLHNFRGRLPARFIAVQAEQTSSKWFTEEYLRRLRRAAAVWDFSPGNVARCRELGIEKARWVPMRIPMDIFVAESRLFDYHHREAHTSDIDVQFYGAESPRRREMETMLKQIPNCTVAFRYYTLFRAEREDLIRRSKIILNMHYWPDSSLEVHRIEYICARGKCIISEPSSDEVLDNTYSSCVDFCKYSDIPERVKHLTGNRGERSRLGREAQRNCFRNQFSVGAIRESIGEIINPGV